MCPAGASYSRGNATYYRPRPSSNPTVRHTRADDLPHLIDKANSVGRRPVLGEWEL